MLLDSRLRRLATYLYVQDLVSGAAVLDVGGDAADMLRSRGAQSVRNVTAAELETIAPGFDVAFALDIDAALLPRLVETVKRILKPDGTLVLGVASRDRPGARGGVSYYELIDLLESQFPSVKMVGQAPFAAATLVEYGVPDPDPVLDATLVPKGERVENYVAVAGPRREKAPSRGYGVMQVPLAEIAALPLERRVAPVETARPAPPAPKPPAPAAPAAPMPAAPPPKEPGSDELKQQLASAQKGKTELLDFIKDLQKQLSERDAYLAELDADRRELGKIREATRLAELRAQTAEIKERETRKLLALAEGQIVALRAGKPIPVAAHAPAAAEPSAELTALRAEVEKLKQKEADARAESWKALKQRADAEAQAAEVREDTVRKLKDARKLASLDLTRATEEAMKKAVTLKEDLARTERERKELVAEVKRLTAELETARAQASQPEALPPPPSPEPSESAETLRGRVAVLERELVNADAIAAADRARATQLLADMESEARERADAAVRVRHALRERDREVAALRHDLSERDARLTALEKRTPISDEVERLEAELATTRARLQSVTQELARKEAQVERAAAAAAHERARAERLAHDERRIVDERNVARARSVDAERHLDLARERLARLESDLRTELDRATALEETLRRAADSARNGHMT
jgi:hypothetical protein